jgi:hypothetical protein
VITHIDLSDVLRRTVCDLYSNLVTRPTGAAVRTEIENIIAERHEPSLTVIDFQHVRLLDFSCADEVVAKLLLGQMGTAARAREAYFVVRILSDVHLDAIESVLERYGLALVVEFDAQVRLVGDASDGERRAWEALRSMQRAMPQDVARAIGEDLVTASQWLHTLHERRLVMRFEDEYVSLGGRT